MADEAVHDESAVVAEREYDASIDLHDSYYAAVAELRQRHVNGLPIVPPEATKIEQAKADFIISYARRVKDWPLMEQAIELKIDEQQDFVGWWDENVRSPGNPSIMSVTDIISAPRATELTGFLPKQVSRWRKHLSDEAKYRAQQILAAYRKAGLEPLSSHRTENTGEYEWYTPARFIEAAREVMGEIGGPGMRPGIRRYLYKQCIAAAESGAKIIRFLTPADTRRAIKQLVENDDPGSPFRDTPYQPPNKVLRRKLPEYRPGSLL